MNQDTTNIAVYHPGVELIVDLIAGKRQRGEEMACRCYLKGGRHACVEKDIEVGPMERIVTAFPDDTVGMTGVLLDYLFEAGLTPLASNETHMGCWHDYPARFLVITPSRNR